MSAHDFVEVGDRRWCLCCDLFQAKSPTAAFFPTPRKPCPRDTPRGRKLDAEENVVSVTSTVRGEDS
jgi:hypothetical protein